MFELNEREILYLWEIGQQLHPLDIALTILSITFPEKSWDELTKLSKGQRDALLLEIRKDIFGNYLKGLAQCEYCKEPLEIVFDTSVIASSNVYEEQKNEYNLSYSGYDVKFRLPNSIDLATIVGGMNLTQARSQLLKNCLLKVKRKDKPFAFSKLPIKLIRIITDKMAELDPFAEIKLDVHCLMCGQRQDLILDIVSLLWSEISALALQVLHQVKVLARFYGWSEQEILAMSPIRRQKYIEMAGT